MFLAQAGAEEGHGAGMGQWARLLPGENLLGHAGTDNAGEKIQAWIRAGGNKKKKTPSPLDGIKLHEELFRKFFYGAAPV